jgi:hypothetical protein
LLTSSAGPGAEAGDVGFCSSIYNQGRETVDIEMRRRESHIQHGTAALSAIMFHATARPFWARRDLNGDFFDH